MTALYLCILFAAVFMVCRMTVRKWHWAGTVSVVAIILAWVCAIWVVVIR